MLPLWAIFTLISGLSSVAFNFISRNILRDGHDSTAYSWWFEFFRFLIFIPFAIPVLGTVNNLHGVFLFVSIGICEFLSIYFYMKMHSKADLSISSIITQARLIWVPFFAYLLLNERLNSKSYIAIFVILIGQIIVSINGRINTKTTLDAGVKYALISTIFVSLNNVLGKSASQIFPVQIITIAMALPSLILFPVFMKKSKERIIKLGKTKGKNIFIAAVFNAFTMIFVIFAFRLGEVSRVTTLYQSLSILQVFMGIIILKENKNIFRKVIGSLIVLMGIYFLV